MRKNSMSITHLVTTVNKIFHAQALERENAFMVKLRDKNNTAHEEAVKKMEELYNLAYNKN